MFICIIYAQRDTGLIYQHGCINEQVCFGVSGQIMEERREPTRRSQSFLLCTTNFVTSPCR